MIRVRQANIEDWQVVEAFYAQGDRSVRDRSDFFKFGDPETLRPMLEQGCTLLAEYDGEPAGMVSVVTANDWWYVVALMVDEAHRGLGVAGELLLAAKALGASRGAVRGAATAAPDLVEFYGKNGFRPVATVMEYA